MKTTHSSCRLSLVFSLFIGMAPLHAQWIKTNGPDGVRSLATGQTIVGGDSFYGAILAGKNGGAFVSRDSGTTWSTGNTGQQGSLNTVAVSRSFLLGGISNNGIFRSTSDNHPFLFWNPVNTGLTNMNVTTLAFNTSNSGKVFAGTDGGGVFLSTNISIASGVTWSAISNGLTNKVISALAASGANVFAGTNGGGIFRSTDTGANWTAVNTGLTNLNVDAFAISGANVFAGTSGGGVFRSTNNGASWTAINAGLTNLNVQSLVYSTNLFAATEGGVFRSTNNGTSWASVNTGLTNLHINALAVLSPNLYAGIDNGVWRRPLSEITTSIERFSADLPNLFSFDRNHSVSFHVPFQSIVSLKVLDLSGREVSVLFAEELPAGTHTRQLNTTTLPNGLYFYRFQSGTFTSTRKVLLSR